MNLPDLTCTDDVAPLQIWAVAEVSRRGGSEEILDLSWNIILWLEPPRFHLLYILIYDVIRIVTKDDTLDIVE